jgi:hypothetical protein
MIGLAASGEHSTLAVGDGLGRVLINAQIADCAYTAVTSLRRFFTPIVAVVQKMNSTSS